MADKRTDRGGSNDRGGGAGSPERGIPIRDNAKKSENTVSFDRPVPPQKPGKG